MRPSRTPLRLLALSAALLAGTAIAHAQTVTRQITTEPVETIVTQQPDGSTIVTRRPIADRPVEVLPAPSLRSAPVAAPVEEETYAEPPVVGSRTVGVRTTTSTRRTATARHVTTAAPRTRTSRSVMRTTVAHRAPLVLTPSERRIVYQTIVQREVYPGAEVAVPAAPVYDTYGGPVVRSYDYDTTYAAPVVASSPVVAEDDVVEPPAPIPYPATTGYAPRPYAAAYVVGSRIPATVPLAALPETIATRVPAVRDYSYVAVGGRVYLVDPATSTVVADITGQY